MLAFTTGAPEATYLPGGRNADIRELILHIQRGMLYFLGMEVLAPFIAYSASRCAPEQREAYLEAYRARLVGVESESSLF